MEAQNQLESSNPSWVPILFEKLGLWINSFSWCRPCKGKRLLQSSAQLSLSALLECSVGSSANSWRYNHKIRRHNTGCQGDWNSQSWLHRPQVFLWKHWFPSIHKSLPWYSTMGHGFSICGAEDRARALCSVSPGRTLLSALHLFFQQSFSNTTLETERSTSFLNQSWNPHAVQSVLAGMPFHTFCQMDPCKQYHHQTT